MSNTPPKKVIPIAQVDDEGRYLFQSEDKVYARSVKGIFNSWRWIFVWLTQIAFYVTPWLNWGGRQAVLFDLDARRFYIFGLVLYPQDFVFLAALLIISAYSLFLFTAVAGRLWCGYSCPQTVYTEIFMFWERLIEGDRLRRMKLDASHSFERYWRKGLKHTVWLAISLWTGLSFVGYFVPIRGYTVELFTFAASGWALFWTIFYGFATYGNAGFMREQVCKYMCPYARFQGAMFDKDTLIVTYDTARGEPRGSRGKSVDYKAKGLGDCVDCTMCVQVCPVGIDIRDGLQYECIGCAACIDACDEIMDKMNYPRGLIRYTTESALKHEYSERDIKKRLLRPRVLGYGAVLFAAVAALLFGIFTRETLHVDIIKDRGVMVRENTQGWLENAYNLRIINASEDEQVLTAKVSGFEDITLTGIPAEGIKVAGNDTVTVPVQVATIPEYADKGSHPIEFTFHYRKADEAADAARTITEKASFIGE